MQPESSRTCGSPACSPDRRNGPTPKRTAAKSCDTGPTPARPTSRHCSSDAVEHQGRAVEAQALYVEAQRLWPGAQAPAVSLARLRTLAGAPVDARAALAVLEVEESETNPFAVTSAVDRSDPWAGYHAAQAWRLGPTVEALQQSFVPMP